MTGLGALSDLLPENQVPLLLFSMEAIMPDKPNFGSASPSGWPTCSDCYCILLVYKAYNYGWCPNCKKRWDFHPDYVFNREDYIKK